MNAFLTNTWTVGIGGGLISGIIVFYISNWLLSKRINKEYLQMVRMANNDLLYSLRPLIIAQKLPDEFLLGAVIRATARKYNVKQEDLYNHKEIADDLTKEILDTPFINSESKLRYCDLTNSLRNIGELPPKSPNLEVIYGNDKKYLIELALTKTIAAVTAISTMIMLLLSGGGLTVDIAKKASIQLNSKGLLEEVANSMKRDQFNPNDFLLIIISISVPLIALAFFNLKFKRYSEGKNKPKEPISFEREEFRTEELEEKV